MTDALIRDLKDRQEITDQIHRYCRAIDRCDEALLRSVFHPDSTHDHGPYHGPSSDFCGFALDLLRLLTATQHHVGNILIDLQGDRAYSEAYWVAYHHVPPGVDLPGPMADHDRSHAEDLFIGGRYIDRFERRDGVWKIAHRFGIHDWQRWDRSDERGFRDLDPLKRGRRDHQDRAYWRG